MTYADHERRIAKIEVGMNHWIAGQAKIHGMYERIAALERWAAQMPPVGQVLPTYGTPQSVGALQVAADKPALILNPHGPTPAISGPAR